MHVVIPMAGVGRRFRQAGYDMPKPLIPVDGQPIIKRLLTSFPLDWPITFICNSDDLENTTLRDQLLEYRPQARIIAIAPHKEGPVKTVLSGLEQAPDLLDPIQPVLINYCDFGFTWDPTHFESFTKQTACDGAILCYTGFHPEYLRPTMYAYCRVDGDKVLEVKEKGHFTPDRTKEPASSGSYWFATGEIAKKALQSYAAHGPKINGEGYLSLVFNELLADGLDVRTYMIDWFLQWGTPQDLADYEYWSKAFKRYPTKADTDEAPQLLMPMAGRGSRFSGPTPKPLIPILGQPMFKSAIEHLPQTKGAVLVALKDFADDVQKAAPDAKVVALEDVTEGQAITCQMGVPHLDPNRPLIVSNCDHGLTWEPAKWQQLMDEKPDVVVWGVKGFPGAEHTPNAFAYLKTDQDKVTAVSCKKPISENPRQDVVLVGTFWFKRPKMMSDGIQALVKNNVRINNEFYLDCVVESCLQAGLDVRIFLADGWLCWGTPQAVLEFDWWYRWFSGPVNQIFDERVRDNDRI